MPSAEETSYLIEVMPDSGQDNFTTHDVDVLVSRIKENLRLSGLKSKRLARRKIRSSPYQLPYNDWPADYKADGSLFSSGDDEQEQQLQQQHRKSQLRRNCRKSWKLEEDSEADSYERFKALLRNGLLIKEAVKRLQTYDEEDEDKEDTWEEESGSTRRASTTSATSTTLDGLDSMDD